MQAVRGPDVRALRLLRLSDQREVVWSAPVATWDDALDFIQHNDPLWLGAWIIKED